MVPEYFVLPLRLDSSAPHIDRVMIGGIGAPTVAAETVETGPLDDASSGIGSSASSGVTGLSSRTTDGLSRGAPPGVSMRTWTPSASSVSRGSVP